MVGKRCLKGLGEICFFKIKLVFVCRRIILNWLSYNGEEQFRIY